MRTLHSSAWALTFCLLIGQHAMAAGLNISLQAGVPGRQQSATSSQKAQPALAVKRGETFLAKWSASNPGTAPLSNITLHVFLDREGVIKPGRDALYETAVVLDFRAGGQSSGEFRMPLHEPGSYVLRVETIGARTPDGRESFTAMRVTVP